MCLHPSGYSSLFQYGKSLTGAVKDNTYWIVKSYIKPCQSKIYIKWAVGIVISSQPRMLSFPIQTETATCGIFHCPVLHIWASVNWWSNVEICIKNVKISFHENAFKMSLKKMSRFCTYYISEWVNRLLKFYTIPYMYVQTYDIMLFGFTYSHFKSQKWMYISDNLCLTKWYDPSHVILDSWRAYNDDDGCGGISISTPWT